MTCDDQSSRIRRMYASKLSGLRKKDKRSPNRKSLAKQFQSEFHSAEEFVEWWFEQSEKQMDSCYYCGTSIKIIRQLIDCERLRTRNNRSKRNEKTGRSINGRGRELELECKDPDEGYSKHNCVLACMYCNNDKSDIFKADEYKENFGRNRYVYFCDLEKRYLKQQA
jgi:hypothetical protein